MNTFTAFYPPYILAEAQTIQPGKQQAFKREGDYKIGFCLDTSLRTFKPGTWALFSVAYEAGNIWKGDFISLITREDKD